MSISKSDVWFFMLPVQVYFVNTLTDSTFDFINKRQNKTKKVSCRKNELLCWLFDTEKFEHITFVKEFFILTVKFLLITVVHNGYYFKWKVHF